MPKLNAQASPYGRRGNLARSIDTIDWSFTGLGPRATWPTVLEQALGLILSAGVPMAILWGEDGLVLHNDAYADFVGQGHSAFLGRPISEAWPELAALNKRVVKAVLRGRTLSFRDRHAVIERGAGPEDVWLNLDFSPILDAAGIPAGVLVILKDTTQRVRVEQRLEIAQQAGGVGTFEWFPESGELHVSQEYRKVWGLDSDIRVTDDLLISLLHPDDRAVSGPERLGQSNPLDYAEYRRIDPKTGNTHWIARRGQVISSERSGRRRFVGIAFDITDRKQAEVTLQKSEERWRGLFEQMHEGFFTAEVVRDAEGNVIDFVFIDINPAFERQTGLIAAQTIGQPVREAIPGVQDELIATYGEIVDTGQARQFEVYIPALGNRWYEAHARKVGPERFAVLFLDITIRKAAEKRVLESEERFRTLSQSMPNHVWTARSDGSLDWFNDQVFSYSGMSPDQLAGNGWAAMVHPDDIDVAAQEWTEARAAARQYQAEFRLRRHDGAYRWHIARAVPIKADGGGVAHWIGTNTDIHDQKEAEAALENSAAQLEARVEERTAQLLEMQNALQQSQKMETIGKLTGGVAHDFNNLLQVISGNLNLLAKDVAGNERAERRVNNALAGVVRGGKLASQLLAFGRRQPLAPKVVHLGRLLTNMDDLLRRSIGEAIEIETIVSGGLWNTSIDPTQMENAVLNLAINARDAMDGAGKLTIEAGNAFLDDAYAARHAEVEPGQYVMLAVTDTGAGMTPDVIEQVFEPFFSTKAEGKGTGLGLSMVYGFVKQSNGHVKIYSEPGHGTTVKLYLPKTAAAEDVEIRQDVGPSLGGSETILVVEDDDNVRDTVIELLSDLGYAILKASDPQSALSVIESGVPIDLLFTDVVMPGTLKSPELARKAKERLPNLAVLFTSGYTENSIVHHGRLDAGVELLSKPYTRDALARKIRQVLPPRQPQAAAITAEPEIPVSPEAQGRRFKVLVVEDDVLIRMDICDMIADDGHQVAEAGSGEQAIEMLQEGHFDFLVTDLGLPGMSGETLVVKAREMHSRLGIIIASGRHELPEGLPAGVTLVSKPFSSEDLRAAFKPAAD
ncbi:PAS domain S-box protein [Agrobacterium vitis]|uniref:histidine kinase n=1 Tax=Agrobacterium vitis TaxID=373 RepID=A0ABD6G6S8_AGRVI|nr:PAS domain S-box protein [Agrobacterium vitis]MUO79741.1 PAS domain S-box protein [Agrobacterium vitis]MUO93770.1 PAS domain S-box protein [Agrobacterium vitis]MUP03979.1 PAS domain S-box protein [Agrobacterium vitis]MVA91972.1 PAS domain S-box protein [Agrobacterium vitis]MVB01459.1 PAS domain S-box protein [Agrobacterium vitis]